MSHPDARAKLPALTRGSTRARRRPSSPLPHGQPPSRRPPRAGVPHRQGQRGISPTARLRLQLRPAPPPAASCFPSKRCEHQLFSLRRSARPPLSPNVKAAPLSPHLSLQGLCSRETPGWVTPGLHSARSLPRTPTVRGSRGPSQPGPTSSGLQRELAGGKASESTDRCTPSWPTPPTLSPSGAPAKCPALGSDASAPSCGHCHVALLKFHRTCHFLHRAGGHLFLASGGRERPRRCAGARGP